MKGGLPISRSPGGPPCGFPPPGSPPPPPPGNPPPPPLLGGLPPGGLKIGPGGGNPNGGQKLKVRRTHGWEGGSGRSGPAACAAAASSVVNILPVFGSIVLICVVAASVITVVLIWSVNLLTRGVTGHGLGGSEVCTTKTLALESVRLGGLDGRDGVVSGIWGTARGAAAA